MTFAGAQGVMGGEITFDFRRSLNPALDDAAVQDAGIAHRRTTLRDARLEELREETSVELGAGLKRRREDTETALRTCIRERAAGHPIA